MHDATSKSIYNVEKNNVQFKHLTEQLLSVEDFYWTDKIYPTLLNIRNIEILQKHIM